MQYLENQANMVILPDSSNILSSNIVCIYLITYKVLSLAPRDLSKLLSQYSPSGPSNLKILDS